MLFGPLLEVCGNKYITERRNKKSLELWQIVVSNRPVDGRLTGHLLDPAEGSQVAGGGGLLQQLKETQKESEPGGCREVKQPSER